VAVPAVSFVEGEPEVKSATMETTIMTTKTTSMPAMIRIIGLDLICELFISFWNPKKPFLLHRFPERDEMASNDAHTARAFDALAVWWFITSIYYSELAGSNMDQDGFLS